MSIQETTALKRLIEKVQKLEQEVMDMKEELSRKQEKRGPKPE